MPRESVDFDLHVSLEAAAKRRKTDGRLDSTGSGGFRNVGR
jgi:hypothetical protein